MARGQWKIKIEAHVKFPWHSTIRICGVLNIRVVGLARLHLKVPFL